MRFTTSQLRQAVANPRRFIANFSTVGGASPGFGNLQRTWMVSAWRAYFASQRTSAVLWAEFNKKASTPPTSERRRALARGAVPMLEQFIEWDSSESASPVDLFPPVGDVLWEAHILAVRRDLIYLTPSGVFLRLLWTDRDLYLEHPDVGLMVAAVLISADVELGPDRTDSIEVWQLREGRKRTWDRHTLVTEIDRLQERLDEVAAALLKPPASQAE